MLTRGLVLLQSSRSACTQVMPAMGRVALKADVSRLSRGEREAWPQCVCVCVCARAAGKDAKDSGKLMLSQRKASDAQE